MPEAPIASRRPIAPYRLAGPGPAALLAFLLLTASCGDPPGDEPVGDPARPAWGEAVDGLRLGLSFDETRVVSGQPLRVTVRAENVGDTPLRLHAFDDEMWWYHVRFENLGEGPDFVGGSGLFLEYETPPDVTLAPGGTWARTGSLTEESRRFLREIPDRRPGDDWDYRDALPPGRYRAHLRYTYATPAALDPCWHGAADSNAVEIEVLPAGYR